MTCASKVKPLLDFLGKKGTANKVILKRITARLAYKYQYSLAEIKILKGKLFYIEVK